MSKKDYKLRDMLQEELDKISDRGNLSSGDLDTVYKLTSSIKNINKNCIFEEEEGYSNGGDWEAMGSYGRNSYRGQRRDSMGRYSRDNRGGMGSVMNSYRYSRAESKDAMLTDIKTMMDDENLTTAEKNALKKAWETLKEID